MITNFTASQLGSILEKLYPAGGWSTRDNVIVDFPVGVELPTEQQMADALVIVDADQALAASRKIWHTVADFWNEFTTGEQYTIQVSVDPTIIVARGQLAMWRGEVWSDDPRVTGALDALVTAAILTTERKTQILNNGI